MPATEYPIVPGAEPYAHDGGAIGVLLIHGFTGSPHSMRPWGEYLAGLGHTVRAIRLPGHGTAWQDLQTTTANDWYTAAETALAELREQCGTVAIGALSMGGAVALRLAEQHPVDALVLVNPYLVPKPLERLTPFVHRIVRSSKGVGSDIKKAGVLEGAYERVPHTAHASLIRFQSVVRRDLSTISAPVLLFRATEDHVVSGAGRDLLMKALPNGVEYVELHDSYHVATLDNDAELIFGKSAEFIERHAVGHG